MLTREKRHTCWMLAVGTRISWPLFMPEPRTRMALTPIGSRCAKTPLFGVYQK